MQTFLKRENVQGQVVPHFFQVRKSPNHLAMRVVQSWHGVCPYMRFVRVAGLPDQLSQTGHGDKRQQEQYCCDI